MISKLLVNLTNSTNFSPMLEGGIYLTSTNIDTITFESGKLYVVDDYINPNESTTYTIPENCVLAFTHLGKFGSNVILNLTNTVISARLQTIFDGTRVIGFMKNAEVPVEWFGAVGDGITDDADAINACIKYTGNQTVLLGANAYLVKSTIEFTEANWESQTYVNTKGANKWPIDKPFICKGVLIGDASLGANPVFRLNMGTNTVYIENVKMLSTNTNGAAVHLATSAKNLFIGKILKVDDGQGSSIPSSLTEPTAVSGVGVHIDGYTSESKFMFGTIQGFTIGIEISSTKSSYGYGNTVRMGKNIFEIESFWNVLKPIYVYFTSGYFNGNTFKIRALNKNLAAENANANQIEIVNATTGSTNLCDLYIDVPYWEAIGTRYLVLKFCDSAVITGHFSGVDLLSKSGSGHVVLYNRIKSGSAPYTTQKIFDFTRCRNILIIPTGWHLPIETISMSNVSNFKIEHATLINSLSSYYVDIDSTICFDEVNYIRKNGEIAMTSSDANDVIAILKPHIRHLKNIEYVSALPETLDTTKWYAIPVTDQGIGKYEVHIYDGTAWKIPGYFATRWSSDTNVVTI